MVNGSGLDELKTGATSDSFLRQAQPKPRQTFAGPVPVTSTAALVVGAGAVAVALRKGKWIPGLLLGVSAMLAPKIFPRFGNSMRPIVKGAVAAGMAISEKAREAVELGKEEVEDLMAEIRAENQAGASTAAPRTPPQ